MTVEANLLKDYGSRIEEMRSTEAGILTFLGFIFTAVSAITTAGITEGSPLVFLVPMALLLASSFYVTDKRWIIWLNGRYIQVLLEPRLEGIGWEKWGQDWRATRVRPGLSVTVVEPALHAMLGTADLALFFVVGEPADRPPWLCTTAVALWLVLLAAVGWNAHRYGRSKAWLADLPAKKAAPTAGG